MKTARYYLLVLCAVAAEAFLVSGCANTARGVSQDYQKAEDKVENAVK